MCKHRSALVNPRPHRGTCQATSILNKAHRSNRSKLRRRTPLQPKRLNGAEYKQQAEYKQPNTLQQAEYKQREALRASDSA